MSWISKLSGAGGAMKQIGSGISQITGKDSRPATETPYTKSTVSGAPPSVAAPGSAHSIGQARSQDKARMARQYGMFGGL